MSARWDEVVDMDARAPPFTRNPSAWGQRVPICILAGLGALISGYLALFQLHLVDSVWDPLFGKGTEEVLTSEVAKGMDRALRIPDAAFGAWGYFSEAILGFAGCTRRWQYRPWLVILFGIDVIPLGGVSALLVLAQGFAVGSWCFLCLCSAVISFILIGLAYDEVWASMKYLKRFWDRTRSRSGLWDVFLGRAHPDADAVALERS